LAETYRAVRAEHDQGSFEDVHKNTQMFIMDAITPDNKPSLNFLEKLCDGSKKLNIKYFGPRAAGIVIVLILSNYKLQQVYPNDVHGVLNVRFNRVHLKNTFTGGIQEEKEGTSSNNNNKFNNSN